MLNLCIENKNKHNNICFLGKPPLERDASVKLLLSELGKFITSTAEMVTDEVRCGCVRETYPQSTCLTLKSGQRQQLMTARILHPQLTINILQPAETHSHHISYLLHQGKRERKKLQYC
jgi:hypothetical protein